MDGASLCPSYCSHDEVYFPKLSCLITADGGTLHSKWAPYNGSRATVPLLRYAPLT